MGLATALLPLPLEGGLVCQLGPGTGEDSRLVLFECTCDCLFGSWWSSLEMAAVPPCMLIAHQAFLVVALSPGVTQFVHFVSSRNHFSLVEIIQQPNRNFDLKKTSKNL